MDSQALLAYIFSQTRQNIEFLIAQKQIEPNDGRHILQKLSAPIQLQTPSTPPPSLTQHTQNLSISSVPETRVATSTGLTGPPPVGPAALFQARALWNYNEEGQDPNDLSFRAGDIIDIIVETNADWWTGRHRGKQGFFPSNYVERLPPPPPPPGPLPSPALTPYATPSSYGGPEKAPTHPSPASGLYPSYQPAGGYQPPPPGGVYNPYGGPAQPQSPPANVPVASSEQPPKKSKFGGKFGSTLAHSAVGGVGFGAGSAVGSGIINSIF